jgi:hypothetical protein
MPAEVIGRLLLPNVGCRAGQTSARDASRQLTIDPMPWSNRGQIPVTKNGEQRRNTARVNPRNEAKCRDTAMRGNAFLVDRTQGVGASTATSIRNAPTREAQRQVSPNKLSWGSPAAKPRLALLSATRLAPERSRFTAPSS